jgi:large subunit ribosomal protein L9
MKVLLRTDVDGVGKKGDIVDVADGHGRNFLIPKGWAISASAGVEAQAGTMRKSRDLKDAADRSSAQEIATKLVPTVITITAKSGAEGKLYGSVTNSEIVEAIAAQTGIEIDRRRVVLADHIKTLGTHQVPVKLHSEVEFPVTIEVTAL